MKKTPKKSKSVMPAKAHGEMMRGLINAGVHKKPSKSPALKKGQRYA